MDYLEWCERVLGAYLAGTRSSLEVRKNGLRPEQIAHSVFGSELVSQAGFIESARYEGLRQAIRDLDDEGLIRTNDNIHGDEQRTAGKITDSGEQFLESEENRWATWWAICVAETTGLKPEHRQLLELVNLMSPREERSYAWMKWVHQDTLASELNWDPELLRLVVQEIRHGYDYILPRPNFYPFDEMPPGEMHVRGTYRGLVLQTKRHLTIAAREIDKLVEEWETTSVDFKRELKTTTKDEKAEFVKDVLGLANTQASGERWLIIGFDDKSRCYHSGSDHSLSQDHIEQVLAAYTDPPVEIRYDVVEHYCGPVGRLRVLREPAKLPYRVAQSVGNKKRIEKGDVFVRHGSQTEKPTPRELEALVAEGERAKQMSETH